MSYLRSRERKDARRSSMLKGSVGILLVVCALALAASSDRVAGQDGKRWQNEPSASSDDVGPRGRWREARTE